MNRATFFYDGECGYCNATVMFLLDNTEADSLYFSPLQSEYARDFFVERGYKKPDLSTAYLFANGRLYQKSSAVLKAIALARRPVSYLRIFLVIPKFVRDGAYDFVAAIRKQIPLGKGCRVLAPHERVRFLHSE